MKLTTRLARKLMVNTLLALAIGSTAGAAGAAGNNSAPSKVGPNLYKWTDDAGKVHYGDHVPAEFAKQERKILNDQGVEMKTVEAARTPEQIIEDERLAAQRKEQEKIAADKASHDRMLLATFSTEDDMIMTRDGKIAAIEGQLRVTRDRIDKLELSLTELTREAAQLERSGKPVPATLQEEIVASRGQSQRYAEYIKNKHQEQETLRIQYEADIKRFRELQASQAAMIK